MKILLPLFLGLCCASTMACDKPNARQFLDAYVGLGHAGPAAFHFLPVTASMPAAMRVSTMEAYARADACLNGKRRPVSFYVGTRLIGRVGMKGLFLPVGPATRLPAQAHARVAPGGS